MPPKGKKGKKKKEEPEPEPEPQLDFSDANESEKELDLINDINEDFFLAAHKVLDSQLYLFTNTHYVSIDYTKFS